MHIRAAIAEAPSKPFTIEQLQLDEPGADEVLVKLVASGVCQTDAHVWNQHIPAPLPMVLGHEGAGVVERVGPRVQAVKPGDRVILSYQSCGHCDQCLTGHPAYCDNALAANFSGARLDGTKALHRAGNDREDINGHFFGQSSFATHTLVTERNIVKVTDDVPLELLGPLGCGLQTGAGAVLNSLQVPAGASVAILGVGSVGFGALMAARIAGAATVIGVDVLPHRLTLAEELGATHTIDARDNDVAKEIRRISGRGVDYVIDTTGRADMLLTAVDALATRGEVGLVAGSHEAVVPAGKIAFGMSVRGIVQGDSIPQIFIPKLVQWYRSGRFPIDRLVRFYDFDDINTAFADAARGEVIKPILRIADHSH